MDVQVLNQIAAQARQAYPPQVGAPVSGNAQLKALKGSPPIPENPALQQIEEAPEQPQGTVTPNISSVARAASSYSAAIETGLNSDELNAIQDLAGKIRPAVSEFLRQPGLEQAEHAEAVVATNPEAVRQLEANLEQAVVETLSVPEKNNEVVLPEIIPVRFGNQANQNEEVAVAIPASEIPISVERVTKGARPNAAVQEVPASTAGQKAQARNAVVENPVNVAEVPENSGNDFTVTAASPALQNTQAGENALVEIPVSRPSPASAPEAPVQAASPALVNSRAGEHAKVENPVNVAEVPKTSNNDFTVTAASLALHNANTVHAAIENPVNGEVVADTSGNDFTGIASNPALANPHAGENVRIATPVSRSASASAPETPVTAASPALQNAQAQNSEVGNPTNAQAPSFKTNQSAARVDGPVSNNRQPAETVQANAASPGTVVSLPDSGSKPVEGQGQTLRLQGETASSETETSATEFGSSSPQPAPAPSHNGFRSLVSGEDHAAVNSGNVRDVNALVGSVVKNEFTAEAKKIFSQPKVIRTVADLAEFILERLQEIIATQQLQKQAEADGDTVIS